MNFEEFAAKPLLAAAGINIPKGIIAKTADEAAAAADQIGPCVIKAQVPTGKRGKAGGIKLAQDGDEARAMAKKIIGMTIDAHTVEKVLVEEQAPIAQELYLAILNDSESRGPIILFSTLGGMDIEEAAEQDPKQVRRQPIDIRQGLDLAAAIRILGDLNLGTMSMPVADTMVKLYNAFLENDAELLEINPLVLTKDDKVIALDCKFSMDDSAVVRHPEKAQTGTPDKTTELEKRGKELGLKYIELEGTVGILANGAGLTMTTMDVVKYFGGVPANFMEIGGEAYTKGKPALELVLSNPKVKSLVINFCGAFARCDVMAEGIVAAWEEIKPTLPVFFSVHGTGDEEARQLLKERLNISPYDTMDQACKAAVDAAQAHEGGVV
ncbi:MAG: ADP-forming succinate--CoA ligase subunit beta [Rhodospirillaceae bacterium]|nr:ADP-forming succinate--CoA ligase subunit beta [Rhodospirillaceae bacterium]|tara:strand:- start:2831 stop:3976 length:1146 start_codon:yes stop_codon:yes gene_type:complete